jgi:hypothetical protein
MYNPGLILWSWDGKHRASEASGGWPVHLSLIGNIAISAFVLTLGCSVSKGHAQTHDSQVLFACEDGNVKSLMAVSHFNQLAQERRLPFRAVSRGTAPDSTTVPSAIIQGLRGDGFDVSWFHPSQASASTLSFISIG